ncbi:MAG: HEPN domain-containing protein [Candidatus Bipolaricaulaceae bacterium]
MTQGDLAKRDLRRAELILEEARAYLQKKAWNLVVRRAQEATELALKAALRSVGVEPPRVHDVGPALREHSQRFPAFFVEAIPKLASISRALRNERETSLYGDVETGTPPEELYFESDAWEALDKTDFVLRICQRLVEGRDGP